MLTERDQKILAAVLSRHVATAEPVSSQQLCQTCQLEWSPATVRNVMAHLEEEGYLNHPYTSAGKVPTVKAYQHAVERLLAERPSPLGRRNQIRSELLNQVHEADAVIRLAAKILAAASQLLAVTWLPGGWEECLGKVRLISLEPRRILVVVHTQTGGELHQTCVLDEKIGAGMLAEVNRLVNRYGHGRTASELKRLAQAEWPGLNAKLRQALQQALHWVSLNLDAVAEEEWVIEGTSNLICQPEFDNISATRQMVSILDQREELIRTFAAPGIECQGVRVVIGDDPGMPSIPALSMVAEEVCLSSNQTVRIGVLGPRRMAYDVIIPLVRQTADALLTADKQRPSRTLPKSMRW